MKMVIFFSLWTCLLVQPLLGIGQDDGFEAWLSKTSDTTIKVDSLNEMAWILRRTNPTIAFDYATRALDLAKRLRYIEGKADSHARLGAIAATRRNRDPVKAEHHYAQALYLREEVIGYDPDVALTYNSIGALREDLGNIKEAINYYRRAIDLLTDNAGQDESYQLVLAKSHNNVGDSYLKTLEYRKAREHLWQGIRIREELGDQLGLASSYLNAGVYFLQEKVMNLDSAEIYLSKSYQLFKSSIDTSSMAKCLLNLGNIHFHRGEYDEAEIHYDKALSTGKILWEDKLRILRNQGSIYSGQGKFEAAMEKYNLVLAEYKTSNAQEEMALLYADMGIVHSNKKQYTTAIEYLKKSQWLADLSGLYRVDLLASTALATVQESKRLHDQRLIMNFSLVISIIVVSIIYYISKKRREAQKKEEKAMREIDDLISSQSIELTSAKAEGQEEERDRIAADLHDRIGAMLSTILLYIDDPTESGKYPPEVQESRYQTAKELLTEACQEVRHISHDMASPILTNQGLEAQIKLLAERLKEIRDTKVNIHTYGMRKRLAGLLELKVYPVITNILGNILKHNKASEIDIELNRFDDTFNIIIKDDGEGFDPAKAMIDSRGMGLPNIAKRLNELKGEFNIDSKLGRQGTTFTIVIPLQNPKPTT